MAECNGNEIELVEIPMVVYISVKNAATTLTWDTDEQYMLDLKVKGKFITLFFLSVKSSNLKCLGIKSRSLLYKKKVTKV